MLSEFKYDVFLSHSANDQAVVRVSSLSASTGERVGVRCRSLYLLRADGLRMWLYERKVADAKDTREELQPSAFSLQPLFRAPVNKERRFILLRFDARFGRSRWVQ